MDEHNVGETYAEEGDMVADQGPEVESKAIAESSRYPEIVPQCSKRWN